METETYNGWKNWETWNIALWIGNDEGLYHTAKDMSSYDMVVEAFEELGVTKTPDGVSYRDSKLDFDALDEMIKEL